MGDSVFRTLVTGASSGIGEAVGLNGKTSGIIPFVRVMDSLTLAISQGSLRRGSAACYLDISHPEIEEFLELRKPSGDFNRKPLNLHRGVVLLDVTSLTAEQAGHRVRETIAAEVAPGFFASASASTGSFGCAAAGALANRLGSVSTLGPPTGADDCRSICGPGFGGLPEANPSSTLPKLSLVRSS